MTGLATALPKHAWLWIFQKTLLITGISVAASIVATIVFMGTFSAGIDLQGLLVSILVPVCIGGPTVLYSSISTERVRYANRQLERMATTDYLTGLLNRRAFTTAASAACSRPGATGVLLVLDIDHFKTVNDRFGHNQGDDALRLIGDVLTDTIGSSAIIGRLGGEEFGIYLPHSSLENAQNKADALRQAVAACAFAPDDTPHALSVSIGGSCHTDTVSFQKIYQAADERLYHAKQEGRDRVALPRAA